MHRSPPTHLSLSLCILTFLSALVAASGPTSIFINQISEYSSLSSCAEGPLKTIVRWMSYDCPDDSSLTSYACFCFSSSAKVSSRIDTMVAKACTREAEMAQNASAVEVFSKYCQLGGSTFASVAVNTTSFTHVSPTSSPSQSSSASPASAPTNILTTPTSTSTPTSNASPSTPQFEEKKTPAVAVAVGVSVPVALIALGIVGFLLYRRRQYQASQEGHIELKDEQETETGNHEIKENAVEIGGSRNIFEIDAGATKWKRQSGPVHELASSARGDHPFGPTHELDGRERR